MVTPCSFWCVAGDELTVRAGWFLFFVLPQAGDSLVPTLTTECHSGQGMAVCPVLGVLVTSDSNLFPIDMDSANDTLSVYALPESTLPVGGKSRGLKLSWVLGGCSSIAPMKFKFYARGLPSGWMVFQGPNASRLLVVTDAGHDAVHCIDVIKRVHVGYVAARGTIRGPRGVAAKGSLVAISAWEHSFETKHFVHIYEGSGAAWTEVRVVASAELASPLGLRFTVDGEGLAVTSPRRNNVCFFRVSDGCFVSSVNTVFSCQDLEECSGGWLVVGGWTAVGSVALAPTPLIRFIEGHTNNVTTVNIDVNLSSTSFDKPTFGGVTSLQTSLYSPSALALVPRLGVVVRVYGSSGNVVTGSVQFLTSPDSIAMASMSTFRVAWMVATFRGLMFPVTRVKCNFLHGVRKAQKYL
jgi:hypothetical protein